MKNISEFFEYFRTNSLIIIISFINGGMQNAKPTIYS